MTWTDLIYGKLVPTLVVLVAVSVVIKCVSAGKPDESLVLPPPPSDRVEVTYSNAVMTHVGTRRVVILRDLLTGVEVLCVDDAMVVLPAREQKPAQATP